MLNIHGAMAHSPAVLELYVAFQRTLSEVGTLDPKTREAIALAVAVADECSYCQAAQTAGGRAAGLSLQQTIDIRRDHVEDPKLAALLALVRQQTEGLGHVEDAAWQGALAAGWTDAQLTESAAHVSLNMITNYLNHLVQTDLDLPAAPEL